MSVVEILDDMNIIYNQIADLSYLLLNRIRNIILSNVSKYVGFYTLNIDNQTKLLEKLFRDINNVRQTLPDTNRFHDVQFVGIEYDNIKYYSQDVTDLPRIYNYGRNINNINKYL